MALDNMEGILQYRERVAEQAQEQDFIALSPVTMLTLLDTLLGVIEDRNRALDAQVKHLDSVTITPLGQRRKVAQGDDLE